MVYYCLFCGKEIRADDALFYVETTNTYRDRIRFEFLKKSGMFESDDVINTSVGDTENRDLFRILYYRASDFNDVERDQNGFPVCIRASLSQALTSKQLAHRSVEEPTKTKPVEEQEGTTTSDDSEFGATYTAAPASVANTLQSTGDYDVDVSNEHDTSIIRIPTRCCPHCHCHLPLNFGLLPVHNIQLIGGRAAGKTAYLICLNQQLVTQLGRNMLGAATLLEESQAYLLPKQQYYEQTGTTMPTPAGERIFPIVYEVSCKDTRNDAEDRKAFIVFNDVAGEGVDRAAYMFNLDSLQRSDNLLYIIDPDQILLGGYHDAVAGTSISTTASTEAPHDYCSNYLLTSISQMGDVYKNALKDHRLNNIFVVMTKMDKVLRVEKNLFSLGDLPIIYDIKQMHQGIVNGNLFEVVKKNICDFIRIKHGVNEGDPLQEALYAAFGVPQSNIFVFGVSTQTLMSIDREGNFRRFNFQNKNDRYGRKHRIIEPMLCILWRLGLLDARFTYTKPGKDEPEIQIISSSDYDIQNGNSPQPGAKAQPQGKAKGEGKKRLFGSRR